MSIAASDRLRLKKSKIMDLWVQRALKEVAAAQHQEDLVLRDSLPIYLDQLVDALSTTIERTEARKISDKEASTSIGRKHGRERAGSYNYSIDQVIYEYHIMRQVICDVLEEKETLTAVEREVIVSSIEQAVNDAATQFSNTLKEIQEQLTQTLAHDFRTPLSVAKLNLQLLLRRPDEMEHTISKATSASVSLDRLDRMIQDLLDASRMKVGNTIQMEFNKNCDLHWIIKEVASDLSATGQNEIMMNSSGNCTGNWNEDGLRRVVENLTTNAIKYGKPNSPVTITLECHNDFAKLIVHNEGDPIPKEDFQILFQQFRRSRKVEGKIGWGLGLTVVKGVVEAHKGEIEVISEMDKGTCFIIKLPKLP